MGVPRTARLGTDAARPVRRRPAPALLLVGLVLVVAACGASGASPSSRPAAGDGASAMPSAASPAAASPAASGAASDEPMPSPTRWPGGVVEAVMILGKADAEIKMAGGDLGAAAAAEDLEAMWGAADGLATLIEKLQTQVPRIAEYPITAKAAAAYDAAFPDMLAGAVRLRDAIRDGDAAGVEQGSAQLAKGIAAYEQARAEIGPLVDQALLMQRILTK